jgi:serine/threonine protein kinase
VLAKVGSPFIANFIDLNEDKGCITSCSSSSPAAASPVRCAGSASCPSDSRSASSPIRARTREPHRLGIVHRDIKPDNMMFVRAGIELEATPRVSSSSSATSDRAARRAHSGPEGATREGAVLATPEFMAPEQCQGAQVTPATDVYALGCCLFA